MKQALVFEAPRTGYGIDQVRGAMTVGELKRLLEDFDDETLIITSHDRGYTYGTISETDFCLYTETEDGEWEEADDGWRFYK